MILIPARSTSSRFPEKHLAKLGGSTVLDVLVSRVRLVSPFAFIIPTGDPLKHTLKRRDLSYMEGPEEDVLKRFMLAMDRFDLSWCVRVTGDCPLISPQDLFWMISVCSMGRVDYGTNCLTAPTDGQEIEFISRKLMERMHGEARDPYDREHVTPWAIRKMKEKDPAFRYYEAPIQYGWQAMKKISVDTPEDLERVELLMLSVALNSESQ